MAAQTGLCLTWSQTPKTCFLVTWLIDISIEITWLQWPRQYKKKKKNGREIIRKTAYIHVHALYHSLCLMEEIHKTKICPVSVAVFDALQPTHDLQIIHRDLMLQLHESY